MIPCYNAQDWIGRTLDSVLAQRYPDLVLVVVDDGSTDASVQRVQAYGDAVILKTGPNRGACHARNQGTRIAQEQGASHILYLDADDHLEGDMLPGAGRTAADTGADIVLCDMHILHYDGRREDRFLYKGRVDPVEFFKGWLDGLYFNPSAVLWKVAFVARIGGWDESLARNQDMDISLRAMFEDPLIHKSDQGAAIYVRANPNSISRNNSHKAMESRMRVLAGLTRRAPRTSMEVLMPILLKRLYRLSRECFAMGYIDIGRQGTRELKAQGFRNHALGSRLHRTLSRLIGLEATVFLLRR